MIELDKALFFFFMSRKQVSPGDENSSTNQKKEVGIVIIGF